MSYTVDHLLSGVQVQAILRLHTHGLHNLQIAHMCYTILRLRTHVRVTQSQDSENAQRNLEIAQILRLRGTCTYTHMKTTTEHDTKGGTAGM